jgi:preprotein translocase subunit SecA
MITDTVEGCVSACISEDQPASEWDLEALNNLLLPTIPMDTVVISSEQMKGMKKNDLIQQLKEIAVKLYEEKEAQFPESEHLRELERVILLKSIDRKWMDHIDDMDQLRQGIGLQAYGNRQPIVEYKFQGFEMFEAMTDSIQEETVKALMHVRIEQKVEREQVAKVTGTNRDDSLANAPIRRTGKKVQPNDPCPCDSGRKYKHCCGRNS